MQKPSPGRIVLAIVDPIGNNGTDVCPAIITRVWGENPNGSWTVNLKTIKDGNVDEWLTSRSLFETEDDARESGARGHVSSMTPGACFWPPRV